MNDEWIQTCKEKYVAENHATDGCCPCCGEIADTDHTFRCTNDDIQEIYKDKMNEIQI